MTDPMFLPALPEEIRSGDRLRVVYEGTALTGVDSDGGLVMERSTAGYQHIVRTTGGHAPIEILRAAKPARSEPILAIWYDGENRRIKVGPDTWHLIGQDASYAWTNAAMDSSEYAPK